MMKKIYNLIIIFVFFCFCAQAQNYKYAWITDIHIGSPGAALDLANVVKDINNKKEVEFVVVTGDITEKGSNDELDTAKAVLDQLIVPYYVIPGEHDIRWSESRGTKFIELWGDDNFKFEHNNSIHIGLNTCIPWSEGGHFSSEDINLLHETIANSEGKDIIVYVHHELFSEVDNQYKTELGKNRVVKAVLQGQGYMNKINETGGPPAVVMSRSLKDEETGWGYTVVESKNDSLFFFEINNSGNPELWGSVNGYRDNLIKYELPRIHNDYADILWQINLESTFASQPVSDGNKLYAAEKDGTVICFDLKGEVLWKYETGTSILSKPAVYQGILIIGTLSGDLISLSTKTGKVLQIIGLGEAVTSKLVTFDVEYMGQMTRGVAAGTSFGHMYCYDIYTFELIWENTSARGFIETEPLIINNKIIYGAWDNNLYCVDAAAGGLLWKWKSSKNFFHSPAGCHPVSDSKYVYITAPDRFVTAIDILLGTTQWRKNSFEAMESTGISSDKQNLFIKGFDNFFIVSCNDGKLIKKIEIDNEKIPEKIFEWNGYILFSASSGRVISIDKDLQIKEVICVGASPLISIQNIKENIFAASNLDGTIVVFTLK